VRLDATIPTCNGTLNAATACELSRMLTDPPLGVVFIMVDQRQLVFVRRLHCSHDLVETGVPPVDPARTLSVDQEPFTSNGLGSVNVDQQEVRTVQRGEPPRTGTLLLRKLRDASITDVPDCR
jgi:hypothetical protein